MSTLYHLNRTLREHLGSAVRELRVALTPVPYPQAWLFLIGCYNSGTTLLSTLLSNHPDVSALPTEGQFLTDQLIPDFKRGLPRMWHLREDLFRLTENDEGPDATRMKKEWGLRLDRSKPVLLEKSPPNTARSRWLQRHFENAHFVAIVRNPYAVAEGIVRKGRPHHRSGGWTIAEAAMQWRKSVEIVLADEPYLERIIWIRYEDLASEPVKTLTKITSFVGIRPYSTDYLPGSPKIHERTQGVSNLNAESFRRLRSQDASVVREIVEPHLQRFGYAVLQP